MSDAETQVLRAVDFLGRIFVKLNIKRIGNIPDVIVWCVGCGFIKSHICGTYRNYAFETCNNHPFKLINALFSTESLGENNKF